MKRTFEELGKDAKAVLEKIQDLMQQEADNYDNEGEIINLNLETPYYWREGNLAKHLIERKERDHLEDVDPDEYEWIINNVLREDPDVYLHPKDDRFLCTGIYQSKPWWVIVSFDRHIITAYPPDDNYLDPSKYCRVP